MNSMPQSGESEAKLRCEILPKWLQRYGLAVVAVAVLLGLRLALDEMIGTGLPPYITFYPATMIVALLAGFGPGVLATVLSALTAKYFLMLPVGKLHIASTIDCMGLGIFIVLGSFISLITELYRRNRDKVTDYEREVALRASEERLAMAASATQIGIFEWDLAKGSIFWTQAHEALFGYAPTTTTTEHDYSRWADRVHPEDLPLIEDESHRCMLEHKPFDVEYRIIWPDGSLHWIKSKGIYQYDNDDKAYRLLGVVIDINKRKQTEETLRKNEVEHRSQREFLECVIANSGSCIAVVKGHELRYEMANQAFQTFVSDGPMVGRTYREVFPEAAENGAETLVQRVLETGEPWLVEDYQAPIPGKADATWQGQIVRLPVVEGEEPSALVVVWDITERKRAEETVRRSEKIFFELVERSPFGIYVVDSQFRITMMNLASQTGTFRNVQPVIGRHLSEVMHILWPEEVAAEIIGYFQHSLDTGEPFQSQEFIIQRQDTNIVEAYEWELHRITLQDGQFGVICYYFDSTKLREAEESLRKNEKALAEAQRVAQMGSWHWDAVNDVIWWSDELYSIYGKDPKIPVSSYAKDQSNYTLESAELLTANVQQIMQTGVPYEIDLQLSANTNPRRWVMAKGEAVRNDRGEIVGLQGTVQDITARKLIQDSLQRSQAELAAAQSISHVGSWRVIYSEGGEHWSCSKELYHIFGYPLDKPLTMQTGVDRMHPEDRESVAIAWSSAIQGVGTNEWEHRIIVDGKTKWISVSIQPVWNANNKLIEVQGVSQDITERKQAEEALLRSESKYRHLISVLPDIVYSFDLERGGAYYSPAVLPTLGYTPEYLLKHPMCWHDSIHPDDLPKVESAIEHLKTGVPFNLEYRLCHADGHWVWINDRSAILTGSEAIPTVIEGIAKDITDRKKTEELLRLTRFSVEHSSDGIFWMTADAHIIDVNEAACSSLGYTREELIQLTVPAIDPFINPKKWQNDFEIIRQQGSIKGERIHTTKDGKQFPVEIVANYIHFDSKELVCTIVRDISERKLMETDLRQAKDAAESANRAKSEFLANMSHEIRTPLNNILGNAQLLEMTDLTSEQLEYLDGLHYSSKNLLALINDILDLSRIEAGGIEIESAELSLHHCINDIIMMQKVAALKKHLVLKTDIDVDVPHCLLGDQLRIKQILINLLGNAVKFTSQGSIIVSARLLERNDAFVIIRISIQDTGIGIAPDALEWIFNPFVQEDGSTTRRFGGTGLGLSICRRLTELMGGRISVESTPGAGSCFTVTLPLKITSETSTIQEVPQKTKISWKGPSLRILLVEDDETNLSFGTTLLRKMGHDVATAVNGKECLATLERGSFDLVLMDIQMPIMNGEEALLEIRRKEQGTTTHQPIIAVTAFSFRQEKERFLAEGFDGHISKPIDIKELMSDMMRVLGREYNNERTRISREKYE